MVPTTQKHPAMESDGLYIFSKQIPFMLLVMLQVITEVFYFIYVNANLMICGVLIILIIFPRHPHDNMHYGYSRPHWQDSLPLSRVFFPNFGDVLALWLLTSSVSLPQNRSVRCVLSASLHACLRTWTWHILSRCSSHSKPVLTIKWNMHAQLFSHSPSSGPLQTRLKKSFTRCARFSSVNGSRVRQFWNKLAYSHNLGGK